MSLNVKEFYKRGRILTQKRKKGKLYQFVIASVFIAYVCILLYLTVFERLYRETVTGLFLENYTLDGSLYFRYSVNLVPFKTISLYVNNPPNFHTAITNLAGNMIAFIPLGFLLPTVSKKIRNYKSILLISAATSTAIELIQLLLRVGSTDIDDVILNAVGGLMGYFIFKSGMYISEYLIKKVE